jgi:cell division protease FtsH
MVFNIFGRQNKQGPGQMFSFNQSGIKQFLPNKNKITFKNVAGMKEEKEELLEIVDFLKNSKKFTDLGAKIPKGVLLMGSPGTGKTLLARAIAGESNVPFFHISGSEFVEMFVGVGASRVRSAFAIAKKASPSILFIDEIDAIGRERGSGIGGGQDEREQTLNQILVEMDGFDNNTNVIVVAATNRPDVLDSALLRPGRFDRRIILHLPDINEREEILKLHLKNKKINGNVNVRKIAERTPGFSGADLESLANEATLLAAKNNQKEVNEEDLLKSIEKVILGPERKSHIIQPKEKEITAYHESGHALVASKLKNADPIHKISIISRGRAAGYTLQLPTEDKNFSTRLEILDELTTLMGGYSAEEIIFDDISTGSANDLKVASEKARAFIMKFGMSKLGPISLAEDESIFLGKSLTSKHNFSEELSAKIDEEMSGLLNTAHKKAKDIINENKPVLEKIAKTLLEKETLEKEEFYALLEEK